FLNPGLARAVSAAEDIAAAFHPVPKNRAAAMRTPGCHRVGCALKAIEGAAFLPTSDCEGLVVFVAAGIAYRHGNSSNPMREKQLPPDRRGVHRMSRTGSFQGVSFSSRSGNNSLLKLIGRSAGAAVHPTFPHSVWARLLNGRGGAACGK